VRNLLDYATLRLLCNHVGVTRVERKRDLVSVNFTPNAAVEPEKLARFVSTQHGAQFSPSGTLKFFVKGASQPEEILARIRGVLEELTGTAPGPGTAEPSGVRS
jgi:transcription-repair coupling factor (superfamily II helicase)